MTTNYNEIAKMLLNFYNLEAGTVFHTAHGGNQDKVIAALQRGNYDERGSETVEELKAHIRQWIADNESTKKLAGLAVTRCFNSYKKDVTPKATVPAEPTTTEEKPETKQTTKEDKAEEPVKVETTEAPVPATVTSNSQLTGSLGALEAALLKVVSDASVPSIIEQAHKDVRQFIAENYGQVVRTKTIVTVNDRKTEIKGVVHEQFDKILGFVANNEPVYLSGPAGSGKSHICKQVADALGLKFYFTNAVTQEYKLTGFTDANGNYQPTQFYKAFTEGGLFMLDEMDASIPEVLTILNGAIANGWFDFPAPIGFKEAHPDFRVIAAGNTTGHGADSEYVGRNQLDAASLDRFGYVFVDYNAEIENALAVDIELANFCREFRKVADKSGIQIIVSYRSISRLAKMIPMLGLTEALSTCLVKGLEKDDINIIYNGLSDSKYKTALGKIA